MSFRNQIQHIKKCCSDRLNIIKSLSQESWDIDTRKMLHKTLIKTINYSFFIFSKISISNVAKLQAIQIKALRILYKKNRVFSIALHHQIAEIETLKNIADTMKNKYCNEAVINLNTIISDLIEEFDNYIMNNKNAKNITILDSL